MNFEKLDIYGFKSFADKTILELKPGITTAIGPNGSGKSNISDAIRWVLGEQSMKSLRGSKSLDVIFSGTQNRKSLGFAEASLIFDNSDNISETNSEVSNCLALTVKKDYSISVVKNVFIRTCKGIWKVAISIFTLNIIKFFF